LLPLGIPLQHQYEYADQNVRGNPDPFIKLTVLTNIRFIIISLQLSCMRPQKQRQKKTAQHHINELFRLAKKVYSESPDLADRYVELALKIRDKFKITLTREQKMLFCKKCHAFLMPGKSCIVREKNKMMLYHCKRCSTIRRFGIRT
jgi:ribonuclease P protein subunit RPR2